MTQQLSKTSTIKKQVGSAFLLISIASSANAGFLDFLFGSKEDSQTAQEVAPAAAQIQKTETTAVESNTESLMKSAQSLLPLLTQQLGVSNEQAEGGMGALIQTAQKTLSEGEFSQLSSGIPGIEGLLAAAPSLSNLGGKTQQGGLGGLLSQAGGISSSLGLLGQLTQQFEALGLSPEMILQFAQIAIDYFTGGSSGSEAEPNTGELLQKGLQSVMGA